MRVLSKTSTWATTRTWSVTFTVGSSRSRRLAPPRFLELQGHLLDRALEGEGKGGRAPVAGVDEVGLVEVQLVEKVGAQPQVPVELDDLPDASRLTGIATQRLEVARLLGLLLGRLLGGALFLGLFAHRLRSHPAGRHAARLAAELCVSRRGEDQGAGCKSEDGNGLPQADLLKPSELLTQLEQNAPRGPGVQESDQVAARPRPGRFVDQRHALGLELGQGAGRSSTSKQTW